MECLSLTPGFAAFFFLALAVAHPAGALSLAAAERELLIANADIGLAAVVVEGASAAVTVAGQSPNPTLSMQTTQYSPQGGLGSGRPFDKALDTTVGLSLPLERGNKAQLRRTAAEAQLDGARFDLREAVRQQRLVLHLAYYDLKLAGERAAIALETQALAAQALAAADKRVAAGDLPALDRHRLAVDALRTANDVTGAQSDLRQARLALLQLMGRGRDDNAARGMQQDVQEIDGLEASDPWPAKDGSALQAGGSPGKRTDVAAAEARITAAQTNRELARSLRTRDVTVGAQVERVPGTSAGLTYGINVSIPLFARYHYDGEVARAEADYSSALLNRQKVLAQAATDRNKARAALEASEQRLAAFEGAILPAAAKALAAIEFAYARGAAPLTDVLDARRTWRATQLDLATARADHAKALAAWRAATEWEAVQP